MPGSGGFQNLSGFNISDFKKSFWVWSDSGGFSKKLNPLISTMHALEMSGHPGFSGKKEPNPIFRVLGGRVEDVSGLTCVGFKKIILGWIGFGGFRISNSFCHKNDLLSTRKSRPAKFFALKVKLCRTMNLNIF